MSFQYPSLLKAAQAAVNLRGLLRGGRALEPGERPQVANDLWTLQGYGQYWLLGRQEGVPSISPGQIKIEEVEDAFDELQRVARIEPSENTEQLAMEPINWQPIVVWCVETIRVYCLGFQASDVGFSTAEVDKPEGDGMELGA